MTISSELQAKIEALEDEKLKARILGVLTGPGNKRASDDAIYESIVSNYMIAKEERARLRQWQDDEVEAFAQYFLKESPEDYVEFLRQEKESNEIQPELAWGVHGLMNQWMPDLNSDDRSELFSKFRHYVRLRST